MRAIAILPKTWPHTVEKMWLNQRFYTIRWRGLCSDSYNTQKQCISFFKRVQKKTQFSLSCRLLL